MKAEDEGSAFTFNLEEPGGAWRGCERIDQSGEREGDSTNHSAVPRPIKVQGNTRSRRRWTNELPRNMTDRWHAKGWKWVVGDFYCNYKNYQQMAPRPRRSHRGRQLRCCCAAISSTLWVKQKHTSRSNHSQNKKSARAVLNKAKAHVPIWADRLWASARKDVWMSMSKHLYLLCPEGLGWAMV